MANLTSPYAAINAVAATVTGWQNATIRLSGLDSAACTISFRCKVGASNWRANGGWRNHAKAAGETTFQGTVQFYAASGESITIEVESTNPADNVNPVVAVVSSNLQQVDLREINGKLADGSPSETDRPELHLKTMTIDNPDTDGVGLSIAGHSVGLQCIGIYGDAARLFTYNLGGGGRALGIETDGSTEPDLQIGGYDILGSQIIETFAGWRIGGAYHTKLYDTYTAAMGVYNLVNEGGDGDLAEINTNTAQTLATMPTAASIASAVWSATSRTLTGFGTLVASIWSHATRTLTGTNLSFGPTAQRSRTAGRYECFQGSTEAFCRRMLGWNGDPLQQADVESIVYSIYELSDNDPPERTAVEGHENVSLTVADVLFDEVQSDELASNYNFKHIPEISTNAAFAKAGTDCFVEYTITPVSGEKWIERILVVVK